MALKGEDKTQKLLSAPKTMGFRRKEKVWVVRQRPGAHKRNASIAIGLIVRDLLGYAKTLNEAKKILSNKKVMVNGIPARDHKLPVGLFDFVDFPDLKERYVVVFDEKSRVKLKKIVFEKKLVKLCKVLSKKIVKKGKTLIGTHDGRSILVGKTDLKVGDSVLLELPGQKIVEAIPLKKNNLVFVVAGKHVGKIAEVIDLIPGTITRDSLVSLDSEGKSFQTLKDYVFVVGGKKPSIEL